MNRVVTLGLDTRWRRAAARECLNNNPTLFLDLCCGTGDLALEVNRRQLLPNGIIGLDYSRPMLDRAAVKRSRRAAAVSFLRGDAAAMPFPDGTFSSIGISFAFRNLTYRNPLTRLYLTEILRVLKPGGRFVIIESSQPPSAVFRRIFRWYIRWFVTPAGKLVSGNPQAYRYLAESVARFYSAEEACGILKDAGFQTVSFRRLFFGAAAIHVAVK